MLSPQKSEIRSLPYASTKSYLDWINKINYGGAVLAAILLTTGGIMVAVEVFFRYVLHSPTTWITEVSTYLVMFSVMLCIGHVLRENRHIRVDLITNELTFEAKTIVDICTTLIAVSFSIIFFWEGLKIALDSYQMGELTATSLRAPRFILLSALPLGGLLLSLQFVPNIFKLFENLRESEIKLTDKSTWVGLGISVIIILCILISILIIEKARMLSASLLFAVLIFCGMPVAISLSLFGVIGFLFYFQMPGMMSQIPLVSYHVLDNEVMAAVGFYILCGILLVRGGVSARLFDFANVWVRHYPGGLAISSIIFCGIFSALSGSSVATAATVSIIAIPEMLKRGYDKKFIIGVLAGGACLGILIPPSLPMMVYGSMTEQSIAQLFMAGFLPGLLLMGMFILYIVLLNMFGSSKLPSGGDKSTFKEKLLAIKSASGPLTVPVIILGGIYSGIFTPTEAAGVALAYSIILCIFMLRTVSIKQLLNISIEGAMTTAMIMLLIVGAYLSGQITAMMQIPQIILGFIMGADLPVWVILLGMNLFLIFLGMPLEAISILVITLPILFPIIMEMGFSPIWFAVIMVINMELALITPPEGLNLYILQSTSNSTAKEAFLGVLPFCYILALFLLIVSLFPEIALWLPRVLM